MGRSKQGKDDSSKKPPAIVTTSTRRNRIAVAVAAARALRNEEAKETVKPTGGRVKRGAQKVSAVKKAESDLLVPREDASASDSTVTAAVVEPEITEYTATDGEEAADVSRGKGEMESSGPPNDPLNYQALNREEVGSSKGEASENEAVTAQALKGKRKRNPERASNGKATKASSNSKVTVFTDAQPDQGIETENSTSTLISPQPKAPRIKSTKKKDTKENGKEKGPDGVEEMPKLTENEGEDAVQGKKKQRRQQRPLCEHGSKKSICIDCIRAKRCPHGLKKSVCKDCKSCVHGKRKSRCSDCGGGSICEHAKRREQCCLCMGSAICSQHGRVKTQCRECKGGAICPHSKRRTRCRECGGGSLCAEHGRRKSTCANCKEAAKGSPFIAPSFDSSSNNNNNETATSSAGKPSDIISAAQPSILGEVVTVGEIFIGL